jgi:hypothetical protein
MPSVRANGIDLYYETKGDETDVDLNTLEGERRLASRGDVPVS